MWVLRSKCHKFFLFLKQQMRSSSILPSLFTPIYFFLGKSLYNFNRRSLPKYKLGELAREKSKVWSFAFDGFLLSKSYKVSAKKVQKCYLSWDERVRQVLKKLTCGFEFDTTTQKSENFSPMGSFYPNYTRFEL